MYSAPRALADQLVPYFCHRATSIPASKQASKHANTVKRECICKCAVRTEAIVGHCDSRSDPPSHELGAAEMSGMRGVRRAGRIVLRRLFDDSRDSETLRS